MRLRKLNLPVSNHEIRKTQVITEKNASLVMHRINKFLLKGLIRDGLVIVYSEGSYQELICRCDYHVWYKDYKSGAFQIFPWIDNLSDIPILAIIYNQDTECIPIDVGDRYGFYNNRLVIYHRCSTLTPNTQKDRLVEISYAK